MKTDNITHEGTIASVGDGIVRVRIVQNSACASCKIAGHCTTTESKEKVIDVMTAESGSYRVGERVMVTESVGMGFKAVLYGFIAPLALMMTAIIVSLNISGASEGLAAVIGLASLIPYYTLLYCLRGYMQKVMRFDIRRIDN